MDALRRGCLILVGIALTLSTEARASASESRNSLRAFESDGCTGFVEGTCHQPRLWEHCCYAHDLRFWAGGSEHERDLSDLRLRDCVAETGETEIAELMYRAVRLARLTPYRPKLKKWGNGWYAPRKRYQPLSSEELDLIRERVTDFDIPGPILDQFLDELRP